MTPSSNRRRDHQPRAPCDACNQNRSNRLLMNSPRTIPNKNIDVHLLTRRSLFSACLSTRKFHLRVVGIVIHSHHQRRSRMAAQTCPTISLTVRQLLPTSTQKKKRRTTRRTPVRAINQTASSAPECLTVQSIYHRRERLVS